MTNVSIANFAADAPSEGVNERTRKGSAVLALENRSRCLDPRYTSRYTIALPMMYFQ
jgi:hypothetical protein